MTDKELASYLDIPIELVAKINPVQRARYERLCAVYFDLRLWDGLGPKPEGVIVCRPHAALKARRG